MLGIDNDPERLAAVAAGRMPFQETGTDELIERVHATGRLATSERVADAAQADAIVLTLGTPSFSHIEIDMRDIRSALDDLLPHLRPGHTIVLRSTVAPGTTEFVAGYLERQRGLRRRRRRARRARARADRDRQVPARRSTRCRASSAASATTPPASTSRALFERFDAPIVQTTPVQAELAKIWANILRYTQFALPNLLMMDCEQYGANVFEVIDLINRDYPRGGIAQPGFTAGTCLRKDFTFSEERSNAPGMLLAVSRVNESVPHFLVQGMKRRSPDATLRGRKVAVLGLAFKGDTDDERDSLAHKLIRLLERELADVAVHDPLVAVADAAARRARCTTAHVVVVAANHAAFDRRARAPRSARCAAPDALVVDPWNHLGSGQVFAFADELIPLHDRGCAGS